MMATVFLRSTLCLLGGWALALPLWLVPAHADP